MALGGAALKLFQTILYAIEFLCAAVVLGIYSYFLSILADRDLTIYTWVKAVTGISGAAVLYLIFAVVLTCCLGGKAFFALIAIILDILFCAGFIAIAVLTRDGAQSCNGNVDTPLGSGSSDAKYGFGDQNGQRNQITYAVSLGTSCKLNRTTFAVAILAALLFALSTLVQLALGRHHKREKRFGPSPANNYTRGTGVRFWQRKRTNRGLRDPEMAGAVPATGTLAPAHNDYRPSHDTAYTGSTVAPHSATYDSHKPLVGGYHAAPTHATPATNY